MTCITYDRIEFMHIQIGQNRRNDAPLQNPFVGGNISLTVKHTGFEPLFYQSKNSFVLNKSLQFFKQNIMLQRIKKIFDVT